MSNKFCIGTGWYAGRQPHSNPNRSDKCTKPWWMKTVWVPYIARFVDPEVFAVYVSNCEVTPSEDTFLNNRFEIVMGLNDARKQDNRHDFHCSVLFGANYAFWNGLDFVYIEQDCLVYGLDKALEFAQGKDVVYGYGDWCSFAPGWAEQCFMFVGNQFLPEFLNRVNKKRFHEDNGGVPEKKWHELFKDRADYWPVGYGRKRPADFWSDSFERPEWWFMQQLSDGDIDGFVRELNKSKLD